MGHNNVPGSCFYKASRFVVELGFFIGLLSSGFWVPAFELPSGIVEPSHHADAYWSTGALSVHSYQLEPGWHRALRRARTKARTLLRAAASGWIRLSTRQRQAATHRLAGHHSVTSLSHFSMAESWQCMNCGQWCKRSASYCQRCGKPWTALTAPQAPPPWSQSGQAALWTESYVEMPGSEWTSQRTKSPGRRPSRGRQPKDGGRGKGKDKGKDKPRDKGKGKGKPMPDTGEPGRRLPPSLATLPAPPTSAGVLLPKSQPAPQDAPSEEMKLLQALAPHLGQLDGLPTALKEQLAGFSDMTHKQEAKALHSLVSRRNKAKAEVERIRADRAGYEATWVAYITQLQELLSTQFQQRSEVLSDFAEAEAAWVATLRETGGALQKAGENPAELVQAINLESDMEDVQKYDPVAVHKANAAEIELGQKQLHEALAVMQATAQHGARRDGSRTPRRQTDSGSVSSPDPWIGNPAKVQKVTEAAKASAPMPLSDGEAASSAAKEKSKALLPFGKPPT